MLFFLLKFTVSNNCYYLIHVCKLLLFNFVLFIIIIIYYFCQVSQWLKRWDGKDLVFPQISLETHFGGCQQATPWVCFNILFNVHCLNYCVNCCNITVKLTMQSGQSPGTEIHAPSADNNNIIYL